MALFLASSGCLEGSTGTEASDGGGGAGASATGQGGSSDGPGSGGDAQGGAGGESSAQGGVGGSSGPIPPSPEECANGEDDDRDGDIDCADSECSDFLCAAPLEGWTGPLAYIAMPAGTPLPECPDGWSSLADMVAGVPVADPAECTPCTCGAPKVDCTLATWRSYSTSSCSSQNHSYTPGAADTCHTFSSNDLDAMRADVVSTLGASCDPVGGAALFSEASWSEHARACEPTVNAGGCGEERFCLPEPEGFRVCVMRTGDHGCPEPYGDKELIHGGYDDQRGCSPCTCGPAGNPSCAAKTEVWIGNSACNGNPTYNLAHNNSCHGLGSYNAVSGSYKFVAGGTASPCDPSGGEPHGTVEPTTPTTICCLSP